MHPQSPIPRSLFAEDAQDVSISFEFFPPKTDKMEQNLLACVDTLAPMGPSFVSVTFGAGGSTRERTHRTVRRLASSGLNVAAHLTCVGATRDEVDAVIDDYKAAGVSHIVALRGDPAEGEAHYRPHPGGYENAADLVAGIRRREGPQSNFKITVAAYPEQHPDSGTLAADLDNLKRKIDAGADQAITQFFFDVDTYFRFLDHCESYGIRVPIIPGILPVTNFATLQSFAGRCGASVPAWMAKMFEGLDERPQTRALVAASVAAEQCRQLYAGGVRDFHFYTLNRAELSYAICHMLGMRPDGTAGAFSERNSRFLEGAGI